MKIASAGYAYIAAMLVVSAFLGGCAMPSHDLTAEEIGQLSEPLEIVTGTLQEPITSSLDEQAAVARAVRHNAQIHAQEMAAAVATAKVAALSASMLPSLVVQSNFHGRSSPAFSHSNQSMTYSTSSDQRGAVSDLTLSWSILDFGLSYVRSLQAADRAAREREELRRVTARIVEETRVAYWRALAYQHLAARADKIQADVRAALIVSERAAQDVRLDQLDALGYQRDSLNLLRELNQLRSSLAGSMQQLKALIGVPQHVELRLRPANSPAMAGLPSSTLDSDITLALRSRHEIRQHVLDMRITDQEVNAAILQLLPGITLSRGLEHDSNSFLLQAGWISWGTKIAWNLINLARLPRDLELVEAQQQVNRAQALATAATIAMQINVARARVAVQHRVALDARTLVHVQNKLVGHVRAAVRVGAIAPQALAKEHLAQLLADVRHKQAEADLQGALAAYATSLGNEDLDVGSVAHPGDTTPPSPQETHRKAHAAATPQQLLSPWAENVR